MSDIERNKFDDEKLKLEIKNNTLLESVYCPKCSGKLELEYVERIKKEFACPICNCYIVGNNDNILTYADINQDKITEGQITQVRPWIRYWARFFDTIWGTTLLAAILGFILTAIPSSAYTIFLNINVYLIPFIVYLIGFIVYLFSIFIEAVFLSFWGTTPWKWLFNIKVRDKITGKKLTYSRALKRSYLVYIRGQGLGIPIVSIITQIVAYSQLTEHKITTWDRDVNVAVLHEKIGFFRVAFIILAIIVTFAIFTILNALS